MVRRKLPTSRKPTDAQRRKSILAKSAQINARPRAESVTVSDDCCILPGILWQDQPTPCRHDCHFSEHAYRKAEVFERGPSRPLSAIGDEETPVSRNQTQTATACGHCGHVEKNPTLAATHVGAHKPMKLPDSLEQHDWPEAYGDGQTWGDYAAGKRPRKVKVAA